MVLVSSVGAPLVSLLLVKAFTTLATFSVLPITDVQHTTSWTLYLSEKNWVSQMLGLKTVCSVGRTPRAPPSARCSPQLRSWNREISTSVLCQCPLAPWVTSPALAPRKVDPGGGWKAGWAVLELLTDDYCLEVLVTYCLLKSFVRALKYRVGWG